MVNLKESAPANVTAAIFDMDDLMINSHPLHMEVFAAVLEGYGVDIQDPSNPWTAQDEAKMFGLKVSDSFKLFIEKYGIHQGDPKKMQRQFDEQMLPVFEQADISYARFTGVARRVERWWPTSGYRIIGTATENRYYYAQDRCCAYV